MDADYFDELERRVELLLADYASLQQEHELIKGENVRLRQERSGFKGRVDAILLKLEGIERR